MVNTLARTSGPKCMHDYCLEVSINKTPNNTRFTNPIFNDIGLIVPINKGRESSIYTAKNSHLLKHNMLFNKLVALNE
jgi:hypothetical protein